MKRLLYIMSGLLLTTNITFAANHFLAQKVHFSVELFLYEGVQTVYLDRESRTKSGQRVFSLAEIDVSEVLPDFKKVDVVAMHNPDQEVGELKIRCSRYYKNEKLSGKCMRYEFQWRQFQFIANQIKVVNTYTCSVGIDYRDNLYWAMHGICDSDAASIKTTNDNEDV